VPLDRLIDKEPRQFAYFHRLMGYSILSLILVIYTFTSSSANHQLYILPILLVFFLLSPKLKNGFNTNLIVIQRRMFYLA
jgi:hypothetical protein